MGHRYCQADDGKSENKTASAAPPHSEKQRLTEVQIKRQPLPFQTTPCTPAQVPKGNAARRDEADLERGPSPTMLTAWAVHRGSPTEALVPQRCAAAPARLAGPPVNVQLLLEVTGLAVAVDEVAQGGAADGDRMGQHLLDGRGKIGPSRQGQPARCHRGANVLIMADGRRDMQMLLQRRLLQA